MDELEALLEKRLIEKISAGEKPRIAVIFPRSGIVLEDLYGGLGEKQSLYSFHPHPCPINNPEAIRDKLEQLDKMGFDAIALIRGGGKYLEELDSRMVIKACAALSTPLLVAAGHFVDNPLIQHVASKDCGTPTMLGVYLAEMKEKEYPVSSKSKIELEGISMNRTKTFLQKCVNIFAFLVKCLAYLIHACFAIIFVFFIDGSNMPVAIFTAFLWYAYYKFCFFWIAGYSPILFADPDMYEIDNNKRQHSHLSPNDGLTAQLNIMGINTGNGHHHLYIHDDD